jgi:hypothetical protein
MLKKQNPDHNKFDRGFVQKTGGDLLSHAVPSAPDSERSETPGERR